MASPAGSRGLRKSFKAIEMSETRARGVARLGERE